MKTAEQIKDLVKDRYGKIADQTKEENEASCCGEMCSVDVSDVLFSEDYTELEGYFEDADLALGCGLPVKYAGIKKGDRVLDLGAGAGNDAFVARALVGAEGKVIGVDMTQRMIDKAKENLAKTGYKNISFRLGEIENMPVSANSVDVAISNCVLNLVPDKSKAYAEVMRVLKPGGHFCISDVVLKGELPPKIREAGEMYAGCVSGALQKWEYLGVIHETGFKKVNVETEKEIVLPDEVLANYLNADEIAAFRASGAGIFSVTVTGEKEKVAEACCEPGCC